MYVAHGAAEARVFEAVRAAGFDDLTLTQSRIARRLRPEGIRVTELAELAGVTKQTAGALVDELAANGYVIKNPTQPMPAPGWFCSLRAARNCAPQQVSRWPTSRRSGTTTSAPKPT